MNKDRNENRNSVFTNIVLVVILIAFPSGIQSFDKEQFFIDMTGVYLPLLVDMSSDADFGDMNSDGYLDIFISNSEDSDFGNLALINFNGEYFNGSYREFVGERVGLSS